MQTLDWISTQGTLAINEALHKSVEAATEVITVHTNKSIPKEELKERTKYCQTSSH